MKRKFLAVAGLVLVFAITLVPRVQADEITDLMNEALRMYNQGDVMGASIVLSQMRMLFEYKRSEVIRSYLPEPFAGWEENVDEHNQKPVIDVNKNLADLNRNRRFEAHRHYHGPGGKEIMVSVEINSAKARNPEMAGDGEAINIKGFNGYGNFLKEGGGEITILVSDSVVVVVSGGDVSREELVAYAQAVNYSVFGEYAF